MVFLVSGKRNSLQNSSAKGTQQLLSDSSEASQSLWSLFQQIGRHFLVNVMAQTLCPLRKSSQWSKGKEGRVEKQGEMEEKVERESENGDDGEGLVSKPTKTKVCLIWVFLKVPLWDKILPVLFLCPLIFSYSFNKFFHARHWAKSRRKWIKKMPSLLLWLFW